MVGDGAREGLDPAGPVVVGADLEGVLALDFHDPADRGENLGDAGVVQ